MGVAKIKKPWAEMVGTRLYTVRRASLRNHNDRDIIIIVWFIYGTQYSDAQKQSQYVKLLNLNNSLKSTYTVYNQFISALNSITILHHHIGGQLSRHAQSPY